MSDYVAVPGITASDGTVPVYNPNGLWKIWNKSELYSGTTGNKRYVPNLNDYAVDIDNNVWYKVTGINEVTFIPEYTLIKQANEDGNLSIADVLLGVGPGTPSDTYRVYLDKSVTPFTLAVDARLFVPGSDARTCKIYKGSDLTNEANVVSHVYDNANNFIGTTITLVNADANLNNVSITARVVPVAYTNEDMDDGEVVTAVFYNSTGSVVSKRQLLVENTAFIRNTDSGIKYITGISLKSPFMSTTNPDQIDYPINVPLEGMFLTGIVEYSDGSTLELPVDGTKFQLFGFDNFVATIIGQKQSLIVKYNLSAEEICYTANAVSVDRFITKTYNATIVKAEGAYTVKLFAYPHWIDGISGYEMRYFLYNLERNIHYNVTPYVRLANNSAEFKPLKFGTRQSITVAVNLQDVDPMYNYYRHVQTLDITLRAQGGDPETNWTMAFVADQDPQFGVDNHVRYEYVNQNLKRIDLTMGLVDRSIWLDRLYYDSLPLVNPYNESEPIVPDWFAVITESGIRQEFALSHWSDVISISDTIHIGSTLFIEFFKRTATADLLLGIAGIPAQQVTSL